MQEEKISTKEKVLAAIISFYEEHGYAPTIREIGEMVGLKSPSSVHAYLTRLFIEGKLETDHPESPRAIRIPEAAKERLGARTAQVG